MKRFPFLTLTLAIATVFIAVLPHGNALFELDRTHVLRDVQWTRLFTGHFTHFDSNHLRWDLLTFVGLGCLAEGENRKRTALTLALAALGIGLAVLIAQPYFTTYRGLSGLDSALFGLIVAHQVRDGLRERDGFSITIGAIATIGFVLKSGYELFTGDTLFTTATTFAPVPLAHLVGFAIGGVVGGWKFTTKSKEITKPSSLSISSV